MGCSADRPADPVKEVFADVIELVKQLSEFLSEESLGRIALDRKNFQQLVEANEDLERQLLESRLERAKNECDVLL